MNNIYKKRKIIGLTLVLGLFLVVSGCFHSEKTSPDITTQPVRISDSTKNSNDSMVDNDDIGGQDIEIGDDTDEVFEGVDTSDWLTYRDEEYGLQMSYPKNWFISVENDSFTNEKRFSFSNFQGSIDSYYEKAEKNSNLEIYKSLFVDIYPNSNDQAIKNYNDFKLSYTTFANEVITYKKNANEIKLYIIRTRTKQKNNETWDWPMPKYKAYVETSDYNYSFSISQGFSNAQRLENLELLKKFLEEFKFMQKK